MNLKLVLIALGFSAIMLVPVGAAQVPGSATPITKCKPENCDPKAANGGTMKTGEDVTNVVLYGHFEDILNQAPLNTQIPDQTRETDLNRGFLMPVIDTNTGAAPGGNSLDFHFKNNEFTMFSSPGLVEYLTDGWRTHQEPGLAADAEIAESSFMLYWYMSAHAVPNENSGSTTGRTVKVGVVPQVGVYARMETGRFKWKGDLIAESVGYGDTQPVTSNYRINMITTPATAEDVFEFAVKMNVKSPVILSSESKNGFLVYINPYQVQQGDPDKGYQVMQADWRVRTGINFPPRVVIPIKHVMQTKASSLSIFEKQLFVRWSFVSVWGSYDLRDASLKLDVTGPGKIDPKQIEFVILKRSVDHDGHFKPVNATWRIDYGQSNPPKPEFKLADGDYELTASISNLQETFTLVQKFNFKVVNGKPDVPEIGAGKAGAAGKAAGGAKSAAGDNAGIPGFEALFLVASLLVAGVVAARRRRA